MEPSNKLVSNHHSGSGVTFDCAEMAGEVTAGWSRGKFVSNHQVGQGVRLEAPVVDADRFVRVQRPAPTVTPLPKVRLVLTLTLRPDTDRGAVRAALDKTHDHLNDVLKNLGGEPLRLDRSATGEQPDGTYRYALTTTADDGVKVLAHVMAVMIADQFGKNTVHVALSDESGTLCNIAA